MRQFYPKQLLRFTLLTLAISASSSCQPPTTTPLDQQVYIWQRQWTAQHGTALQRSHSTFSHLRILAAQSHPTESWINAKLDVQQLRQDQRPIIAVIRLDGQLTQLNHAELRQQIQQLLRTWQQQSLNLVGLEIDHDCASAKLAGYVDFLRQLRQALPDGLSLSITALPAWLDQPALTQLRQLTDHSVLQVHAVNPIQQGLFDAVQAAQWIRRYERQAQRPFYVALPAYGAGVTASGAVESEVSLPEAGIRQEYRVDPRAVVDLMQQMQQRPPPHLNGWVWFRLPLSTDQRAWSWSTLQAVINQKPLRAHLQVQVHASTQGLYDLKLVNLGELPAVLPAQIQLLGQRCSVADVQATYQSHLQPDGLHLSINSQLQNKTLAAGHSQPLGWVRCQQLHSSSIFNHASPAII